MTPLAILPGMGYSDPVIADTMVESFEARGLCFNPFSGNPCVGLGEQIPRAFCRLLSPLAGSVLVPASDSGPSEKRYCCVVDETPHKWASKIAPIPRKAVGYTLVPHWTRIEGTLAKSGCH